VTRKKQTDIKIKIAVITGLFLFSAYVISAYIQSPLLDTQWQDRPIVYLSLGWEQEYPNTELQTDEFGNYLDIVLWNEGKTAGKTIFVAKGFDAKIRVGKTSSWNYEQILPFTVLPDKNMRTYPIYVLPEENTDVFSIEFSVEETNEKPPFQELTIFRPTILTFENQNGTYKLIERDGINIETGE